MIQFYKTYKGNEIVAPMVRQICLTNNLIIFSYESSIEKKELIEYRRLIENNKKGKPIITRQHFELTEFKMFIMFYKVYFEMVT